MRSADQPPAQPRHLFSWLFAILVVFGALSIAFGETVPAGGGLGWDGVTYADMTRNIWSLIEAGGLNGYYARRLVPPVIVRTLILAAGQPLTDGNIILFVKLYNLGMLLATLGIYKGIAARLRLGAPPFSSASSPSSSALRSPSRPSTTRFSPIPRPCSSRWP